MRLTFQSEQWPDVVEEMRPLFAPHWLEVGVDRDAVPMDMDYEAYMARFENGNVHVTTARANGKLVGYYVSIVDTHLHYRSTIFGFGDLYYIAPAYRNGGGFLKLVMGMEKAMRDSGVVRKLTTMTKLSHDISPIFLKLGWKPQEIVLTKVLE